eukprot:6196968-Pleurochrysis_carterae.AAC.9
MWTNSQIHAGFHESAKTLKIRCDAHQSISPITAGKRGDIGRASPTHGRRRRGPPVVDSAPSATVAGPVQAKRVYPASSCQALLAISNQVASSFRVGLTHTHKRANQFKAKRFPLYTMILLTIATGLPIRGLFVTTQSSSNIYMATNGGESTELPEKLLLQCAIQVQGLRPLPALRAFCKRGTTLAKF